MHMVWINLIPQLASLWTGTFKGLDDGTESYQLHPDLWETLGDICDGSGATIPSAFGCRVPHLSKRSQFIAESWCLWATQLAPNLLRRRFLKPTYYVHFVQLIKLMKECMEYSMSRDDLPRIRKGFADWVQEYERIYYQYDPDRLQTCPVNVHYLLHIADSIEAVGPVWCYWAYPMERFCSFIGSSVKSRRFPYANIARRIRDTAQLRVVKELYNLHDVITFGRTSASTDEILVTETAAADRLPNCTYSYPTILLLSPHSDRLTVTPQLRRKVIKHLCTAFRVTGAVAGEYVPESVRQWGRIRMTGGGDLIHARGYHKLRPDGRDASFVRYELLVDRLTHRPNAPEDLQQRSHYGQLDRVFALKLRARSPLNPEPATRTLLLALVLEAPTIREDTHQYSVIWYQDALSSGEVVDANTIQCTVGRVQDRKRWWIIDRSSELAYPVF
ncbi:hypothetical protein BDV93DRAFT_480008, partial [Ceratobasidium sp. AG-I]